MSTVITKNDVLKEIEHVIEYNCMIYDVNVPSYIGFSVPSVLFADENIIKITIYKGYIYIGYLDNRGVLYNKETRQASLHDNFTVVFYSDKIYRFYRQRIYTDRNCVSVHDINTDVRLRYKHIVHNICNIDPLILLVKGLKLLGTEYDPQKVDHGINVLIGSCGVIKINKLFFNDLGIICQDR